MLTALSVLLCLLETDFDLGLTEAQTCDITAEALVMLAGLSGLT